MKSIIKKVKIDMKEREHHDLIEDTVILGIIKEELDEKNEYKYLKPEEEVFEYVSEQLRVENSKIKYIGQVYESQEVVSVINDYENGEHKRKISRGLVNKIYYLEEYDVYFICYPTYTLNGKRVEEVLLYKKEEQVIALVKKAMDSIMQTEENQVIMLTDTPNGVERERRTVTQIVDKKDVILDEELKNEIYDSINQFFGENEEFYKKYKIPHKRGILLHGPPGNGKTTIIKSLLGSIEAPVVYWQITEYTNSSTIKEVFRELSYYTPAVLVIEDLESMPMSARSALLNILDGATTEEGIFIIGTTNYPERIDEALVNRPGRFDKLYEMKLPKKELRYQYLKMRKMDDFFEDKEIEDMSGETDGFSFVQLGELFRVCTYKKYVKQELDVKKEIKRIKDTIKNTKKGTFSEEKGRVGF